ncbi:NUDIX domain-containing protein [Nocardia sp. NPDC004068]|uniref:NUDIX domain-containing protein n=1 Tax=Nocardia sp. NPDC004068 TaxID=3364303 RepID=UPI0036BFFA89
MDRATTAVADLVRAIPPLDDLERDHLARTRAWLAETDDIFRRVPPATPSPHLVSYIALVDPESRAIYLGAHRKSGLRLPMGGHVEPGEHPRATALREAEEELGIAAEFTVLGDAPVFLSVSTTVGSDPHVDVSLWYVVRGDRTREYPLAPAEFDGGDWWDIDTRDLPPTDPHLPRFLTKLAAALTPDRSSAHNTE